MKPPPPAVAGFFDQRRLPVFLRQAAAVGQFKIADGKIEMEQMERLGKFIAMRYLLAFLFCLFLLATDQRLAAQLPQFHAQVFGEEQGIAAGNIHAIFKDRRQFLWVAAGNVLQRFDGRNVLSHAFESNVTQALCDRDNRIWALSGEKIWRSRPGSLTFDALPLDTAAGAPCAIFQLTGRPVGVLTKRGFFHWDEKKQAFHAWKTSLPPAHFAPGGNRFDTCGTTIFYPGDGVWHAADLATGRLRSLSLNPRFSTFCALTPDLVVVSHFDGVSQMLDFSAGTVTTMDAVRLGLSDRQRHLNLMDVVPLGDSLFLVTTRFGACTFDLRRQSFTRHRIFSEGKPVELEEFLVRIFQDENGSFWAHNTSNVLTFNSIRQTLGLLRNYHDTPERRWSSRVVGFAEDAGGGIWFGGFNGFNRLDLKTGQVEPHPPAEDDPRRLSHVSVRGLAFDGGTLILGPTLRGAWLYEPAADRFFRPLASEEVRREMEQEFVNGILPLRNGNFLLCGNPRQCLLEAGSHRLRFLPLGGGKTSVQGACQAEDGKVWLAARSELFVLDEQCNLLFVKAMSDGDVALCAVPLGKDSVLVGTEKGLRLLHPASAGERLAKVDLPLENVQVRQIYRDRRGRFWLATNDGLFLADARLRLLRRFDFADNIQSRFYNPFSMFRASNGLLFLGGHNGINYFYPENVELEAPPLAVSLHPHTPGEADEPGGELVFSHRERSLAFEIVAPYFNNAGKLQYRYRLLQQRLGKPQPQILNPQPAWVGTNGSHVVRLENLPPGNYRLEVAASLAGATWYAAPGLDFCVRPAFWQTCFFKILLAGACLVAAWLLFRLRERWLKKRQLQALEIERLKAAAAAAKLQSLRLQMNPHFLFNALNSIQELVLTGNADGAATYLTKFSKLLRKVLAHSEQDFLPLGEEIEMLRLYLELESLRFPDSFEFFIECAPGFDPGERRAPTLLIQPFVENAIWHGLLHKEGKRRLLVRFETEGEERLICTVEDNGVGRQAPAPGRQSGRGINAGEERLRALNSRYGQCNALEIMDLKTEDGAAGGTRVLLKLEG